MIKPLSSGILGIVTTNGCTAKCAHCLMNCAPGKKEKLSFEQIRKAIDQLKKDFSNIHLITFTGGEPTLLGEDLIRAIRYCTLNSYNTKIVTNAHWATSLERAKKYIKELRDVGLTELDFSVDDFHEPFVPLKNIKNAWEACKGAGFTSVVIANSHGKKNKITPAYIQKFLGEKIATDTAEFNVDATPNEDGSTYLIHEASLQKSGRAVEQLNEKKYIDIGDRDNLSCCCPWICNDPVLSPIGHIWACCGIHADNNPILDLGNMAKESIKSILNRASDNIILNALHYLGPVKVCKFVESHSDIRFNGKFYTVCELCGILTTNKEAIKVIRKNYEELVPLILFEQEQEKRK